MKKNILFLLVLTIAIISGCAQNDKKDHVVTIKTNYGDMVAILYDETPKHKENFIKLSKEKYFDSLLFHRVITGFMIQGGDPDSKKAAPGLPLGQGGPGYTIEAEIRPNLFHEKGALAAARLGDSVNPTKASSGSQFYIVHGTVVNQADINNLKIDGYKLNSVFQSFISNPANKSTMDTLMMIYNSGDMAAYQKKVFSLVPRIEKATGVKVTKDISPKMIEAYTTIGGAPHLDGEYTVFGKIIKGLDVVDKIAAVTKGPGDRPMEDIRMFITVEEMPKRKITKEYGYTYPESK